MKMKSNSQIDVGSRELAAMAAVLKAAVKSTLVPYIFSISITYLYGHVTRFCDCTLPHLLTVV